MATKKSEIVELDIKLRCGKIHKIRVNPKNAYLFSRSKDAVLRYARSCAGITAKKTRIVNDDSIPDGMRYAVWKVQTTNEVILAVIPAPKTPLDKEKLKLWQQRTSQPPRR